jgi:hypothetical protein
MSFEVTRGYMPSMMKELAEASRFTKGVNTFAEKALLNSMVKVKMKPAIFLQRCSGSGMAEGFGQVGSPSRSFAKCPL